MSLIIGIEYCKLDSNGRFKLPIAIKKQLEGEDCRFVIRPSIYAECLELWTYASFEAEIAHLQKELNPYSIEDRKMLRILSAGNIVEMEGASFSATASDGNIGVVNVLTQPTCAAPMAVIEAVAGTGYRVVESRGDHIRYDRGGKDHPRR